MKPRLSSKLALPGRMVVGSSHSKSVARLRPVVIRTRADPRSLTAPTTSLAARAAWRIDGRVSVWHRGIGATRPFSLSSVLAHGGIDRPEKGTGIKVTFQKSNADSIIKTVEGNEGDDIVDLAWEYDIDIEAACEKSIACSTCHIILEPKVYDALPEPTDEENDMLDLAFGLTETSRLGCQIKLTKDMDGMVITLPSATRNMAVDGHKATHH